MSFALVSKVGLAIAVSSALTLGFVGGFAANNVLAPGATSPSTTAPEVLLAPPVAGTCSWQSEPFSGVSSEQAAKLTLIDACGKVRGKVTAVMILVKGERTAYHFLLKPDAQFASMVNSYNDAEQGGALVIEVLPPDAAVMPRLHVDMHLEVEGPFVTDTAHGWNEIHPARVIAAI